LNPPKEPWKRALKKSPIDALLPLPHAGEARARAALLTRFCRLLLAGEARSRAARAEDGVARVQRELEQAREQARVVGLRAEALQVQCQEAKEQLVHEQRTVEQQQIALQQVGKWRRAGEGGGGGRRRWWWRWGRHGYLWIV